MLARGRRVGRVGARGLPSAIRHGSLSMETSSMPSNLPRSDTPPLVLVIDDDPIQRTLVRGALERTGARIEEAADGRTGLEAVGGSRPDLVVLDVIMPDIDGFAVCAKLRASRDTVHIPILMIAGLDDTDSIDRAFEAGATAFLAKPINLLILGYHVKYMLRAARLEREIRDSMCAVQEASVAKSQFLANMSHELRTPLNAIMGFSEVMLEERLGPVGTPKYLAYAKDINQSANHLLQIINDILDISKIESGNFDLKKSRFRLDRCVDAVVRLVGGRAEEDGVTIRLDLAPDLPPLWGDQLRTKQILLNLISNAVKFTPGGGTVTIDARLVEGEGLRIGVSDTGIGIPLDEIDKALSLFGQVDGGLNRKFEGTGLGLPLAKLIAERLGGSMTLESAPGAGTRATLSFPAGQILDTRADQPEPRKRPA
ncbi:MAG: ATP-binding protein [Kiloniellaceae bacterium]